MKRFAVPAGFLLLIMGVPVQIPAANVPLPPYVEVNIATEGPLSIFCTPDGGGYPLTQVLIRRASRSMEP